MSNETNQDSEPNLPANPANPLKSLVQPLLLPYGWFELSNL